MSQGSVESKPPSYIAIGSLIATYAELVDCGDFAGVGVLLRDATFSGGAGTVSGGNAIEKMLRDNVIVYEDGTPRTKHITANAIIEVDEETGTAVARSYFTVLQALPELSLRPIASGRYEDRFGRRDGDWCFVERRVRTDLVGDMSHHLRRANADPQSRLSTAGVRSLSAAAGASILKRRWPPTPTQNTSRSCWRTSTSLSARPSPMARGRC